MGMMLTSHFSQKGLVCTVPAEQSCKGGGDWALGAAPALPAGTKGETVGPGNEYVAVGNGITATVAVGQPAVQLALAFLSVEVSSPRIMN